MTMLTHPGSAYKPAPDGVESQDATGTTPIADLAMLKLFCLRALGLLLAGGAVAAIIALKAAIALSRVSY